MRVGLRLKVVAAIVGLVTVATVAIGVFSYSTTRSELLGELDSSLRATSDDVARRVVGPGGVARVLEGVDDGAFRGRSDVIVQLVDPDGRAYYVGSTALPVSDADRAAATSDTQWTRSADVETEIGDARVLTTALGSGRGAIQVARGLAETQAVLDALRTRIWVASVVVIIVAALIGAILAHGLTRRLVRLTRAVEQVGATGRLDVEVPVGGTDEAGRLAEAFGAMLSTLARSKEDQQRLVQDAGHELRTPLTSLRTNVYTLRRGDELDDAARRQVLDDLDSESSELARLVDEVVEVATDRRGDEPEASVDLGDLVERVAARASQRSGRTVEVHRIGSESEQVLVLGRPLALERAVGNLLENALKFDRSGGPIEVTCEGGRVEVADRGPGIGAEDRVRVFDRFHRATSARSLPGSGLGLAIVDDVVRRHGGRVFAAERSGGGAVVGFVLPRAGTSDASTGPD